MNDVNTKRCKITKDKYGIYLGTTINGWQWTEIMCDIEMLNIIKDEINSFLWTDNHNAINEDE